MTEIVNMPNSFNKNRKIVKDEIIKELEDILEKVKSDEILGVAFTAVDNKRTVLNFYLGFCDPDDLMIGCMKLQRRISKDHW